MATNDLETFGITFEALEMIMAVKATFGTEAALGVWDMAKTRARDNGHECITREDVAALLGEIDEAAQ